MKKKATLQDIAKALNISTSTASRALQNNPRISEPMRKKVIDVANELNYFDAKFPETVIPRKLNAIGVIVPKISYHLYAMAISGIEKVAEENGMHLIICQSNESFEREKSLIEELIEVGVSGLIISLASETKQFDHFLELKKKQIPLVFFNRQCDEVDTDKVVIDNFKAAYDATEHLTSIGCKNIAFIGGPPILQISNTRQLGYEQALKDANINKNNKLIEYCNFTKESNLSAARKLLYAPTPPDGIIAFSDQVAISAMLAAKERGLNIPEDLAIIGFNNEPVNELLEPSLTSIDQPAYQMGFEAAQLIFSNIKNKTTTHTQHVLKSELVIRNSTNRNKRK
ncbi:LacI family transcriptional regulator [Seonamhaeicola algicola]|uniref:LacI family transcriptional regulator n=1 Tax=Seonamhaeicola algicola TaxID=1719036 RepID=A0A5C7B1W2_9FLAO|nr:LacI family DNA-binding transcriptional regulator [Seonamhaeicola algicola]TXE15190.1 LacI family transcriptional regulator [Seonamhaeicola algicola]